MYELLPQGSVYQTWDFKSPLPRDIQIGNASDALESDSKQRHKLT